MLASPRKAREDGGEHEDEKSRNQVLAGLVLERLMLASPRKAGEEDKEATL